MSEERIRRPAHKCPGPNCDRRNVIDWIDDGVYKPGWRSDMCSPGIPRVMRGADNISVPAGYGQFHGFCKALVRCKCLCHAVKEQSE